MARPNLNDFSAFLAIVQEGSFTRASAKLGVSSSALSQTITNLEKRLGFKLLTRTTRSVAPTNAGHRLAATLSPLLATLDAEIEDLGSLREQPAGSIRISADEASIDTVLWPALRTVLARYPDIHIEIDGDQRLTDIVAAGYDAGVRMGGLVAKDMIAVPIGPDVPVAVVAAPSYLATRSPPATPHDLTSHRCINLKLPTRGGLYVWDFERDGRELRVRVEGQVTFSAMPPIVAACRDGFGLAYVPRHLVAENLDAGDLVQLLPDWTPPFPGFQLYYPSRRHSAAFAEVVNALRYRT